MKEEEVIVAYSTDGKPLTLKAYNQRLKKAEEDIKNGNVYTTEELKKKIYSYPHTPEGSEIPS